MFKMYDELASWWHLVSAPDDYVEEAAFYLSVFDEITAQQPATLLELGSGGGNNALYLKPVFASVTLVDLSPKMLEMSRTLNPDCEHFPGDMRTVRLDRQFDAVFIHDAIDYMLTVDDLRQAIETAYLHCKPGGMALLVPDDVAETFEAETDHGGEDGDDGRSIRFLEWSYDPDPDDTTTITEYIFVVRDGSQPVRVVHDQHTLGLFPRDTWLQLLREVGFQAEYVMDSYGRCEFIARKPK
ncbi:MAG: methyltransferase domain-containing protein [Armatimonadetes bacterium]|nr:methyltransferase domain-containing protein [Anaerolineae bacterium]